MLNKNTTPSQTEKRLNALDSLGPSIQVRNQRLAARYELRARVEFCWIDEQGASRHAGGMTRDISTKGSYILGSGSPPKGTAIAMNIEIPVSGTTVRMLRVQAEGHVVRVEQPGNNGTGGGFSVQNDRVTAHQG